jgi:hypothetical protein
LDNQPCDRSKDQPNAAKRSRDQANRGKVTDRPGGPEKCDEGSAPGGIKARCETKPNQGWNMDLMYLHMGGQKYDFVAFLDENSRSIKFHEIRLGMDSISLSNASQKAIELLRDNGLSL